MVVSFFILHDIIHDVYICKRTVSRCCLLQLKNNNNNKQTKLTKYQKWTNAFPAEVGRSFAEAFNHAGWIPGLTQTPSSHSILWISCEIWKYVVVWNYSVTVTVLIPRLIWYYRMIVLIHKDEALITYKNVNRFIWSWLILQT